MRYGVVSGKASVRPVADGEDSQNVSVDPAHSLAGGVALLVRSSSCRSSWHRRPPGSALEMVKPNKGSSRKCARASARSGERWEGELTLTSFLLAHPRNHPDAVPYRCCCHSASQDSVHPNTSVPPSRSAAPSRNALHPAHWLPFLSLQPFAFAACCQ